MAFDGWFTLGGVEIVNVARAVSRGRTLGVDAIRIPTSKNTWIETALSPGSPYSTGTNAPWYDASDAITSQFAGVLPLRVEGIDDSSAGAEIVEFTSDGGHVGRPRNATKPIVFSAVIVGSTEAGADFGLRWLKHQLRDLDFGGSNSPGADLRYFSYVKRGATTPPFKYRRKVRLSRGISITRRRSNACQSLIYVTFTLTAGDPFEYGDPIPVFSALGGTATGARLVGSGNLTFEDSLCPEYDYSPLYDPAYPSLLVPPPAPSMIPAGWVDTEGLNVKRYWAETAVIQPDSLSLVPIVTLTTDVVARMVRVSIWSFTTDIATTRVKTCDPLWSAVVTYLPPGEDFILDGESETAFVFSGGASRLAGSLVYAPDATPIQWNSFSGDVNSPGTKGFVVTLDTMELNGVGAGYEGDTVPGGAGTCTIRAKLDLVEKSD
jgi:hypothetical protein